MIVPVLVMAKEISIVPGADWLISDPGIILQVGDIVVFLRLLREPFRLLAGQERAAV
jgi:hypothetical protein